MTIMDYTSEISVSHHNKMFSFKRVVKVIVYLTAIETLRNYKIGTRDWSIAIKRLTVLLFSGILTLVLWVRNRVEHFKH